MKLPATFTSLRHPNYRLLWFGQLVSSTGDWMDTIAFNWLVYSLTNSAVALGIINFCRAAPIVVFTLVGGVLADRMERRKLMFITQTAAMLLAFLLAALVILNVIEFWMVVIIATLRGTMLSFNQPARQSLISDLVPREDLMNAVALFSATQNLTRILGPALGGVLIATVGVAGAFLLNALSFVAVLYSLSRMQFGDAKRPKSTEPFLQNLLSGMRYIRRDPLLSRLIVLALLPLFFGFPYQSMLTVFAKDVLQVGAPGLGIMNSVSAVGALAGALVVASLPPTVNRVQLMLGGIAGFGLTLMVFAASQWFWLSLLALLAVGVCRQLYNATNNTMIQLSTEPEFRGRVISTMQLDRGVSPLGTMLAGFGSELYGAPWAIGGMASMLVVMAVVAAKLTPSSVWDTAGAAERAMQDSVRPLQMRH